MFAKKKQELYMFVNGVTSGFLNFRLQSIMCGYHYIDNITDNITKVNSIQ